MTNFETVSPEKHNQIRIDESKLISQFSRAHLVNIEISEAIQAASEYPLFFSKVSNANQWALSALCGLAPGENVFEIKQSWQALYTPLSLKTLPFTLQFESAEQEPAVLIDTHSPAVSHSEGEALYLSTNRPTAYFDNKKKILKERVSAMSQTASILSEIAELGLIQPVDLVIEFSDNTQQRVGGLATLNEHRIQSLTAEELNTLNQKNVLSVVFNILGSIFQVNRLIRFHNTKFPDRSVSNIKFETSKS